jgi:ADP-heptose:LPS heptosyltransferase
MKTSFQVKTDRYLGWFLCVVLRFFVRILGFVLGINHKLDRDFKRIVVCKFKGMGSVIQASALLDSLRKSYPDAEIVFVSSNANVGILNAYSELINRKLLIDDKGIISLIRSSLSLVVQLWKFRPQVYIDLEVYSNFSSLICTLSAATNRLGYYKSDKDYRSGLYTHLMYYNIKAPLMEIYLQMGRVLPNTNTQLNLVRPNYADSDRESMKVKLSLNDHKYLVINPNASDLRLERRWSKSQFISLIGELLHKYPDYHFVLTGSKSEAEYVDEIKQAYANESRVVQSAGVLDLNELFALIDGADAIVTNDTGPLHLSLAFRRPVCGLFGPCSPAQYGQMETCTPIYKNVYCSPCVHEFVVPPCLGNNQCMQQIEVREVLDGIFKTLTLKELHKSEDILFEAQETTLGYFKNRP